MVRLGYGRLTQVFLATREVLPLVHEPVVVKQVHKHSTQDSPFVQAFLGEAALLRKLEHPRIVQILDAGVLDGHCFIAEEYLEGQPLRALLRRASEANGLPREIAVYVAICVLEGLQYAHEAKDEKGRSLDIVHRDLGPHNVFVTNEGGVKISDFRMGESTGAKQDVPVESWPGTTYTAPEQRDGVRGDRRADVWSVGAVLWEALSGKPLFADDIDAAFERAASRPSVSPPSTARAGIPAVLDAIVLRALAWNPAERYQSALEMQRELERWLVFAGERKDAAALGALMRHLFANEVVEQRRLVTVLGGGDDPVPSSRPVRSGASRSVPPPIPRPPPPPDSRSPTRSTSGPPPISRKPSSGASGPLPVSRSEGHWSSRTLGSAGAVPADALVLAGDPGKSPEGGDPGKSPEGDAGEGAPPSSDQKASAALMRRGSYRSLAAIAVVCAGLSAAATYVVVSAMRARSAVARGTAATPNEPSEKPARAPEQAPRVPSVPNVATAEAVATTSNDDAPQPPTLAGAEPTSPAEHLPHSKSVVARPSAGARAIRETPAARPDDAPLRHSDAPVPASTEPVAAAPPIVEQPAAEFGFLTVDTTPWSLVSENGRPLGQTPLVRVQLSRGVHVLSLKNPELGVATTCTVTILPGKTLVKRIGLE